MLFPAALAASMLSLTLTSCLRDGSIIDPTLPQAKIAIGHFLGQAFPNTDSSRQKDNARIYDLLNPKLTMVWQFIGPKEFTYAPSEANVELVWPFKFSVDLRDPPPKEVLESPDLAIGTFWLYQDANRNGKLDRIIHPDLLTLYHDVDRLHDDYNRAVDSVMEVADLKFNPVDVSDTYCLGKWGTLIRMVDGRPDTIWTGTGQASLTNQVWSTVLDERCRVLQHQNRWERFFALRKRDNDYYKIPKPLAGYAQAFDYYYQRRLFPKPGMEAEFEKRVRSATNRMVLLALEYVVAQNQSASEGWIDYPYNGYLEPGQDWVAARMRKHCVLYLKDQQGFDELINAERNSSFSVAGKEKLHLGYNLIFCDDRYVCSVLDAQDTMRLDIGATEAYFNPPAHDLPPPYMKPATDGLAGGYLKTLEGAYKFQVFQPFFLKEENGALWTTVPQFGTFRLAASDSLNFYSPARELEVKIVKKGTKVEKILVYSGIKCFVATLDSTLSIPEAVRARFASIAAVTASPHGRKDAYVGGYEFATDTLKVAQPAAGDSLLLSIPGMTPHYFQPLDDSAYFSPYCDCRVAFRRGPDAKVTGLTLGREGVDQWVPSFTYVPRTPSVLFPELAPPAAAPDSEVSSSQGSARDTYAGLDGKPRYAGSADGRFLVPGDGWVVSLDHSIPGDSISLSQDGEGITFKLPDLRGAAAGLEVTLRKDALVKKARVRLRLVGGADPAHLDQVLAEEFWTRLDSDSTVVSLASWPVSANPYYVRLERIATAEPSVAIAFDAYRIVAKAGVLAKKAAHADP
jgi:hypothetical protein